MRRCVLVLQILGWLWLGGCAVSSRLPDPGYDPLPALFPVRAHWPPPEANSGWVCDVPEPMMDTEVRACSHPEGLQLVARLRFAGAYADGAEAVDRLWPGVLADVFRDADTDLPHAPLRVIRPALGTSRTGRSLWVHPNQLRALFVVDPWVMDVQVHSPNSAAAHALAETALTALVARVTADPEVLCDPRVAVLRVPWGMSNVASHGRVVFVSRETDHLDPSTVAELRRLASMRREQSGCPPLAQDFSAVEAALRRRSRSR